MITERGRFKAISPALRTKVAAEVKMMLHASRDCLRNQGNDTTKVTFHANDGYYGEAMGVMRGLAVLGYGFMSGACNVPEVYPPHHNLRWWFDRLEDEVLDEEGFHSGTHECDYCLEHHGKDAKRKQTRGKNIDSVERG